MAALPISCFIITKNEGDRIAKAINSVRDLVDDIVILDSGSTDNTKEVSESLGATFHYAEWEGYGPQKRRAELLCKHDWILNLDADEVLTMKLETEIREIFAANQSPDIQFYSVRIVNIYPTDAEPRLWADYIRCVRLYNKQSGRFSPSETHDTVVTNGQKIHRLKGIFKHYSSRSLYHSIEKANYYTTLQAQTLNKSRPYIYARLPFEFPLQFFKYYILRRHFTGGSQGLAYAYIAASFRFLRLIKMLEAKSLNSA